MTLTELLFFIPKKNPILNLLINKRPFRLMSAALPVNSILVILDASLRMLIRSAYVYSHEPLLPYINILSYNNEKGKLK